VLAGIFQYRPELPFDPADFGGIETSAQGDPDRSSMIS